jgi:type VI secretion system protein ImpE
MTAKELYRAGKLNEAVQALNAEVRDNPSDAKRRTFLFELLCFSGNFDRAEKQLHVLSQDSSQAQLATVLYLSALHAERTRQDLFQKRDFPSAVAEGDSVLNGTINGLPFQEISDADPRIGPRLEVFAAGAYLWIPFKHVESIEMEAPTKLRDLLWIPALVRTGPAFKDTELGEVLLPAMTVFACKNEDDSVRLGRTTIWHEEENVGAVPLGQKMFLVDDEEFSILEVRKIEFHHPETEKAAD